MHSGYALWADWVNNEHGGINVAGLCHRAVLIVREVQDELHFDTFFVEEMTNRDGVQFIFAPYSPTLTYITAAAGERTNTLVMVAGGSDTGLFTHDFHTLFGLFTTDESYTSSSLEEAFRLGARTAVIAYNDHALSIAQGARKTLERLGMRTLAMEAASSGDLSSMFTRFRELNPDVFIGSGYTSDIDHFMKTARAIAFNAPAFLVTSGLIPTKAEMEYVWGAVQWHPTLRYADDYFGTAAEYAARYTTQFGIEPSSQAAGATAAALALQLAIESADALNTDTVRAALLNLEIDTFFGAIDFDENGVSQNALMVTVQVQMGKLVPVTPSSLIWPMPTWEERATWN